MTLISTLKAFYINSIHNIQIYIFLIMEFLRESVYKAAIDYAREKNYQEIFDILSKRQIKASEAGAGEIK